MKGTVPRVQIYDKKKKELSLDGRDEQSLGNRTKCRAVGPGKIGCRT